MSLCCTRCNDAHKGAFVQSSVLRWVLGDLHFKSTCPDYIHRLVEHFRESSSPERRTVRFFKGTVSLADLKLTLRRLYAYF